MTPSIRHLISFIRFFHAFVPLPRQALISVGFVSPRQLLVKYRRQSDEQAKNETGEEEQVDGKGLHRRLKRLGVLEV